MKIRPNYGFKCWGVYLSQRLINSNNNLILSLELGKYYVHFVIYRFPVPVPKKDNN